MACEWNCVDGKVPHVVVEIVTGEDGRKRSKKVARGTKPCPRCHEEKK